MFITTPSLKILEERLNNRNSDSLEVIEKRLKNAKKEIEFDFTYSEQKMFIKADKKEILKVLDTLLENAIEHTPPSEAVKVNYFALPDIKIFLKFKRMLHSLRIFSPVNLRSE